MPAYYEPDAAQPFEPAALVVGCIENGVRSILLDQPAVAREFFDLSTGLAGELLQKLANYRIRLAVVLPDPSIHSLRFREFAREANKGNQCHFFGTRGEAIDRLEA